MSFDSVYSIGNLLSIPGNYETVKKDTYLFTQSQQAAKFYLVTAGKFRISKFSSDGRELALRLAKPASIIGELTLFSATPTYLFNAQALEDSEVYAILNTTIEERLQKDPIFTYNFMGLMSEHMRMQHMKFRDLVLFGKKGAFYSTLIRLCTSYGRKTTEGITIDIPFTNQELALYSNATRESINKMVNELKEDGVLSIKNKRITIHDLLYLKQWIACEDCPASICRID